MASNKNNENLKMIDLTELNIMQLTQLMQQLDQELNIFQDSLHSLKVAHTKFQESKDSLDKITPASSGKSIMVPLNGSVYVPGKLSDANKMLIDIGTGYYVEKDLEGARDYFQRKITFVSEQMEKVEAIRFEKAKVRETIVEVMKMKLPANFPSTLSA